MSRRIIDVLIVVLAVAALAPADTLLTDNFDAFCCGVSRVSGGTNSWAADTTTFTYNNGGGAVTYTPDGGALAVWDDRIPVLNPGSAFLSYDNASSVALATTAPVIVVRYLVFDAGNADDGVVHLRDSASGDVIGLAHSPAALATTLYHNGTALESGLAPVKNNAWDPFWATLTINTAADTVMASFEYPNDPTLQSSAARYPFSDGSTADASGVYAIPAGFSPDVLLISAGAGAVNAGPAVDMLTVEAIPEPATMLLLGLGALGLLRRRR